MLKTTLETLDGLDEALKPFYAEAEGAFVLQVEGVDAHPEIANLKNAYERVKADREALKAKLADAEKRATEALKDKPDQAEVMKLRQTLEAERDAALAKVAELEGKLTGVTRDSALAEALKAAGITNPAFVKAATALLQGNVKMEGGQAIVESDMGPVEVSTYVKRWAASEGKDFVSPPAGGGAKGNQGGQPTTKAPEQMSATERAELLKTNPDEFFRAFPHAKLS